MIRSYLCEHSDPYILVKRTINVLNTATLGATVNNTNEEVISKNCAPITNCVTEINNTQVDDIQYINIVVSMYTLIEYSDAYSKA